jgi:hypothetical protein
MVCDIDHKKALLSAGNNCHGPETKSNFVRFGPKADIAPVRLRQLSRYRPVVVSVGKILSNNDKTPNEAISFVA